MDLFPFFFNTRRKSNPPSHNSPSRFAIPFSHSFSKSLETPCRTGQSPGEKDNFALHPRTVVYQKRITIDHQVRHSSRVHRAVFVTESVPAQLRVRVHHTLAHYHLRCQKTRWHLKERSQGQEASLRLYGLGPGGRGPYRQFLSPHLLL